MRFTSALLSLSLLAVSATAETKLVLNKKGAPASLDAQQITVPAGERVVLSIPVLSGNVWFKDGQPIYGASGRVFIIDSAQPSDSGHYRVGYVGIENTDSQEVVLTVTPTGSAATSSNAQKLLTFTARGYAGTGNQALVTGFIVGEKPGAPTETKRVLVRAVGATLEEFGLTDFLRSPQLAVFKSSGETVSSTSTDPLELEKAELAAGAYPLKKGSGDAWQILRLAPGAYAAQVTSGSSSAGYVIVEIYDLD
jgi:hypothetical protein